MAYIRHASTFNKKLLLPIKIKISYSIHIKTHIPTMVEIINKLNMLCHNTFNLDLFRKVRGRHQDQKRKYKKRSPFPKCNQASITSHFFLMQQRVQEPFIYPTLIKPKWFPLHARSHPYHSFENIATQITSG